MTRRLRFIGGLALLLLIALGGWYYQSPSSARDRFLRALALGDEVTLEQSVDFPAVRNNLRDDLMALASRNVRLAPQLDAATIDPLLDVVVSPAGLEQLVNSFGIRPVEEEQQTVMSYHYRSASRVDVRIRSSVDAESAAGIFTLERSGASWRLVRIWSDRLATSAESS